MYRITNSKIYRHLAKILEKSPLIRSDLLSECIKSLGIPEEETKNKNIGSFSNNLRSRIGECINEMHSSSMIGIDKHGRYYPLTASPLIIRIEKCEKEIIKALSDKPHSQAELRDRLTEIFGTDKTVTRRDDDILSTYIGALLKKLISYGAVKNSEGTYSLAEKISATKDDINALLTLKSEFIEKLHSKGGEFFENYFMTLLSKYERKHGKKILECYVTGGSADGGIDGVIKTEDSLGFREITMVQTKNRVEIATETDIRGFYGAVCAKRGTRGIYAITSDFHGAALAFADALDDCIGVNGDMIFSMAIECLYGIKKSDGKLTLDTRII